MSGLTPRLDLYLPGGGSTGLITPDEIADIDKINDNFAKIDDAVGAKVVTSVTRPGSPYNGQLIYETDTKRIKIYSSTLVDWEDQGVYDGAGRGAAANYIVSNPAALDSLTNAAVGDTAWMSAPGAGITPFMWVAVADSLVNLDWRPQETIKAATTTDLTAFIAVIAATTDLRFDIGARVYNSATKMFYRFGTAVGAYGIVPGAIIPTATATGGAAVVDQATGVVTVTGACTILDLDGIPADATEIRLIMNATFSTALGFSLQLRAAGVVENSGSSGTTGKYDQEFHGASASTPNASPAQALTAWAFGGGAVEQDATIVLRRVGEGVRTMGEGQFYSTQNPQTTPQVGIYGLQHRNGTAYDGIRIALSGAGTMVGKFALEVVR